MQIKLSVVKWCCLIGHMTTMGVAWLCINFAQGHDPRDIQENWIPIYQVGYATKHMHQLRVSCGVLLWIIGYTVWSGPSCIFPSRRISCGDHKWHRTHWNLSGELGGIYANGGPMGRSVWHWRLQFRSRVSYLLEAIVRTKTWDFHQTNIQGFFSTLQDHHDDYTKLFYRKWRNW